MGTLIIDNYDSFTFNLVSLVAVATGETPAVIRNDEQTWEKIRELDLASIIISPGPGHPERTRDFGVSADVIRHAEVPVLGVCLGHQGIAVAFGGEVRQTAPVHGYPSEITHDGDELFRGIPRRFSAIRYHSLAAVEPLPPVLRRIAWTADGTVMALRHITRPLWGVQFHPESISTEYGADLIRNFLSFAQRPIGNQPLQLRATAEADSQSAAGFQPAPQVLVAQASEGAEKVRSPLACARGSETLSRVSRTLPSRDHRGAVASSSFSAASLACEVRRLPLHHTPEVLYRGLFGNERYAFWLDSSLVTERSRFSYMGASPEVHTSRIGDNVFDWLTQSLQETRIAAPPVPFPFTGGYVGYFGYELKAECGAQNNHQSTLPDSILLRVDRFLVIDHQENNLYAVAAGNDAEEWLDEMERRIAALNTIARPTAPIDSPPIHRFGMCRPKYLERIRECLSYIAAGESYELCLTNKVLLETSLPALDYYETLRRTNPAPYSAYLQMADVQVASSSPECFLRIDREGRAESRPIKGTIRRGCDPVEDSKLRDLLAQDPRFRAENLMIVDLVRNDLTRVCVPESVHVPRMMEVETYRTLHQLVSTIAGQIAPGRTTVDCLRALFPGGSMTGAPKLRTMELLDELEPEARGIYSGCLGYLGFNGTADLSIVIRTAVFDRGHVSFGVGGAIVAQSDPAAEWDEMELKAQALLRAFDPTLQTPGGLT